MDEGLPSGSAAAAATAATTAAAATTAGAAATAPAAASFQESNQARLLNLCASLRDQNAAELQGKINEYVS